MQLHNIIKSNSKISKKSRIGRGGKRGKTSGHGHKGQKQHGRHGIRPEMRDFIKSLPKLRGFGKNRARTINSGKAVITSLNLSDLHTFKNGDIVSPDTLVDNKIIKKNGNKLPKVKILGGGEITVKVSVEGCLVSETAKTAIEKVGGSIK